MQVTLVTLVMQVIVGQTVRQALPVLEALLLTQVLVVV